MRMGLSKSLGIAIAPLPESRDFCYKNDGAGLFYKVKKGDTIR